MTVQPSEDYRDLSELSYAELAELDSAQDQVDVIEVAGYALVEKDDLEDKPFIITKIIFRESDNNNVGWVSVEATTSENEKVVFNDSGTGVFNQLVELAEKRGVFTAGATTALKNDESLHGTYFDATQVPERQMGNVYVWFSSEGHWNIEWRLGILRAKRGLRKSEYGPRTINGEKIPGGTTWYLA